MSLTLQDIHARCTECGDCRIWDGATNGKGDPKIHTIGPHGKRIWLSGRRIVMALKLGRALDRKELVTASCGNKLCLEHLEITDRSAVSRRTNAQAATRAKRSVASARTNQAKIGKLTMEAARAIRASDKTGRALAHEYGVSYGLISRVRLHRGWKEQGNPFAGLGA